MSTLKNSKIDLRYFGVCYMHNMLSIFFFSSIVSEAEAAIANRFEVLEPQIYNSNARQVPKSPEWFMSASAKIKVIAKNMTKAQ